MEYLRDKVHKLTDKPGVYLMKDKGGNIIYVGKAKRLKNRVSSYFRKNSQHNEKVRRMVSQVQDFDFIVTDSEFEALVLECSLIKQYNPKYNILLKDDKGYHYVWISPAPYSKITAEKQKPQDGTILGPYTSSFAVTQTVDEANRVFMLPTCSRRFPQEIGRGRPCLNYYIKQCSGVCTGKISAADYADTVNQAVAYMKNGSAASVEELKAQMLEASENLQFERAALIRNRIQAMQKIAETQKVRLKNEQDLDTIAMAVNGQTVCFAVLKFRNGRLRDKEHFIYHDIYDAKEARSEFLTRYYAQHNDYPKILFLDDEPSDLPLLQEFLNRLSGRTVQIRIPQRSEGHKLIQLAMSNATEQLSYKVSRTGREIQALDELTRLLGLDKTPEYIEAYDISNLGDSGIVGGMVVFQNGRPLKSAYKRFSIRQTQTRDDYASMREMLDRRLRHYVEEKESGTGFGRLPDLILLDGGKGHVAVVREMIEKYGLSVPLFGMVKDDRHRTRAIAVEGGEIAINAQKQAFALVTRIQDEVHRFTIQFQRNVRKKTAFEMELTRVQGIGPKKALALLSHFKTKKAIKEATAEELRAVAKISLEKAEELRLWIAEML